MKTYAYITRENCTCREAYRPGETKDNQRVSKHGDLASWTYSKRETRNIAAGKYPGGRVAGNDLYLMKSARAVVDKLGWA